MVPLVRIRGIGCHWLADAIPIALHCVMAVLQIGPMLVVRCAGHLKILHAVVTAPSVGTPVIELEPVARCATPAMLIHERTLAAVSFVHGTPDRSGNVPGCGRRVGLGSNHEMRGVA